MAPGSRQAAGPPEAWRRWRYGPPSGAARVPCSAPCRPLFRRNPCPDPSAARSRSLSRSPPPCGSPGPRRWSPSHRTRPHPRRAPSRPPIERLRKERAYYQARLPEAERALTIVGGLKKAAEAPRLQKELAALEDRWRTRRDYLASQLAVVEVQLEETLAPPPREPGWLAAGVREFLFGRGLSVVLALGAYALTHVSLLYGGRALARALRRARHGTGGFLARLLPLAAHALTVVVSLLVAMTVLYLRGDWLLLALLILFVVGLAFALRQSVPRYVKEARVLLNMGSVREGERVVYNGIPWKLTTLGLYSNLHNPLLTGGTVRLSIDELAGLHSRPFGRDEPYFPSREGDFVMLDEELYCKVLLQTPEVVQVEFKGAVKTLPTRTYLDKSPRNLSTRGFAVVIVFGLDYRHQAEIVGPIERQLEADIRADLQAQPFADQLRTLLVEYNEASASSLDVLVVGVFEGSAADRYWTLRRFLQRSIVGSCNRHGWTIPFPQLTVHAPPGTWSAPGTDRQ